LGYFKEKKVDTKEKFALSPRRQIGSHDGVEPVTLTGRSAMNAAAAAAVSTQLKPIMLLVDEWVLKLQPCQFMSTSTLPNLSGRCDHRVHSLSSFRNEENVELTWIPFLKVIGDDIACTH
jgi:hypothetical protein